MDGSGKGQPYADVRKIQPSAVRRIGIDRGITPQTELIEELVRESVAEMRRRYGPRWAGLRPIYLGDDLYACQPICRAMLDSGGDFLPAAKPASHPTPSPPSPINGSNRGNS